MSRKAGRLRDAVTQTFNMQRRGTSPAMGESPLARPVYTEGPKAPDKCGICSRNPKRINSEVAECSHVECPHRRSAWSERPSRAELFKGPWPKNEDADPLPLDAATGDAA